MAKWFCTEVSLARFLKKDEGWSFYASSFTPSLNLLGESFAPVGENLFCLWQESLSPLLYW
jgi:hypothetical protein